MTRGRDCGQLQLRGLTPYTLRTLFAAEGPNGTLQAAQQYGAAPYSKDWYAILASPSTPELLYAAGPQKDSEHWSPDIPDRYHGVKIREALGSPRLAGRRSAPRQALRRAEESDSSQP